MKYTVTGAQAKLIDRDSIERIGIPSLILMERAASAVASAVEAVACPDTEIFIACGAGNNGADGIAAGRILHIRGYRVQLVLVGNPEHTTEEFRLQKKIAENLEISMCIVSSQESQNDKILSGMKTAGAVIVDALFGIGLSRNVEGVYRSMIEWISKQPDAKVIAVDIPSGIHSDNGAVLGIALKADITVTFGNLKTGLVLYPGRSYAGEVQVVEIGFAPESIRLAGFDAKILEEKDLADLPERRADGNKGTFGKLLLIAGSEGMSGAAYLSALAAYRMGVGLVKILTVEANRVILQSQLPEAIVTAYDPERIRAFMEHPENETEDFDNYLSEEKRLESEELFQEFIQKQCEWADAIVLGPGLGQECYVLPLIETVLEHSYVPIVLDADGLNTIAKHSYLTRYFTENMIVTPHVGEMSRLTGLSISEIKDAAVQTARNYSTETGVVCVLKDASTIITDKDGTTYINISGCSAMAKGGSGDVLAGMIGALAAQGMDELKAAAYGAFLHGRAGKTAAEILGERSLLAHDIADHLHI